MLPLRKGSIYNHYGRNISSHEEHSQRVVNPISSCEIPVGPLVFRKCKKKPFIIFNSMLYQIGVYCRPVIFCDSVILSTPCILRGYHREQYHILPNTIKYKTQEFLLVVEGLSKENNIKHSGFMKNLHICFCTKIDNNFAE